MNRDQINELKADLDTMIGNSSQLKAEKLYAKGWRKQEWISVDERLPEEGAMYLVNIIDHFGLDRVTFTVYSRKFGWALNDVTHWMPLPEAPKMKGGLE